MTNAWKAVWNRRQAAEVALTGDGPAVLHELERRNGVVVVGGGLPHNTHRWTRS